MTAPHDPRVQRIASAITPFDVLGNGYAQNLARVLVEELGGREGQKTDTFPVKIDMHGRKIALGEDTYADGSPCFVATAVGTDVSAYARTAAEAFRLLDMAMRAHESVDGAQQELGGREGDKPVAPSFPVEWRFVLSVLDDIMPGWANGYMASGAIRAIAEERDACRAQQRENAETNKALKERVETAERANTELDNARKSAEQSARDLRAERDTLRAELDAIKGAQVPTDPPKEFCEYVEREMPTGTLIGTPAWWSKKLWCAARIHMRSALRHPAPALPAARVVGACVEFDKYLMVWTANEYKSQEMCEAEAKHTVKQMKYGEAYELTLGKKLTPNADGQTARVDEVSDTANGLRHVARGPNSPQGAVAYGRTAKDATQLLDTIRQHKSTPNADGAK